MQGALLASQTQLAEKEQQVLILLIGPCRMNPQISSMSLWLSSSMLTTLQSSCRLALCSVFSACSMLCLSLYGSEGDNRRSYAHAMPRAQVAPLEGPVC